MPGGDGTGPLGLGPMTGRAAGYCAGYPMPGYMNPVPGRGWLGYGRGLGRGRGWGRGLGWRRAAYPYTYGYPSYGAPYIDSSYPDSVTPQQEAEMLKGQAKAMQQEIDAINQRITELEAGKTSEGN